MARRTGASSVPYCSSNAAPCFWRLTVSWRSSLATSAGSRLGLILTSLVSAARRTLCTGAGVGAS